jgi:hypothetical protein
MALFDTETWDGKPESLPEEIRNSLAPKPDPAEEDRKFNDRVQSALNKRAIDSHLSSVKSRVGNDLYEAKSEQFRKAVTQGGLSIDEASSLYFPASNHGADSLKKPPVDPAGSGAPTPPSPTGQEHEWTRERVMEQQTSLRKMSFKNARKWREQPENADFVKAELNNYSASNKL